MSLGENYIYTISVSLTTLFELIIIYEMIEE